MVEEGFKECRDCHSEKPFDQFRKHPDMADGGHNYSYRRLEGDHRDNRRTRPLTPQGHRLCPDCGERKPATEFAARKKADDGLHTYCKRCNTARGKASDERLHGSTRNRRLKDRYGIGADDRGPRTYEIPDLRDRLRRSRRDPVANPAGTPGSRREAGDLAGVAAEMIENRGRVYKICLRKPVEHVDHDHTTGEVRGVLCFTCNVGLGNFTDDPELMQRGINYLKGAAWPSILRESPGVYRMCS